MPIRRRVHEIVDVAREGDRASYVFDAVILSLISLNVGAIVVESIDAVRLWAGSFFFWFEWLSVAVFSVEYLLRLWSCVEDPRFAGAVRGRIRWALGPLPLIDLVAVAPAYLVVLGADLRILRVFRLFRILRLAKLVRYSRSLQLMGKVFRDKRHDLVVTLSIVLLMMVVASSLMYYVEHEGQPETFSSIPASMWWAVATLTTVGYGDALPVTPVGRVLASVIAILGIGLFALPTSILGSGFVEQFARTRDGDRRCPHCGERIEGDGEAREAAAQ